MSCLCVCVFFLAVRSANGYWHLRPMCIIICSWEKLSTMALCSSSYSACANGVNGARITNGKINTIDRKNQRWRKCTEINGKQKSILMGSSGPKCFNRFKRTKTKKAHTHTKKNRNVHMCMRFVGVICLSAPSGEWVHLFGFPSLFSIFLFQSISFHIHSFNSLQSQYCDSASLIQYKIHLRNLTVILFLFVIVW